MNDNVMEIKDALITCIQKTKFGIDSNDKIVINSIESLLSSIVAEPSQLLNIDFEQLLSLMLTRIFNSQYTVKYQVFQGYNVRNLVYACSFYLYMHQLEFTNFYDSTWPAFIRLIHGGRCEFSKLIPITIGSTKDEQQLIYAAKGFEFNMMRTAKRKGFLDESLTDLYDELSDNGYELLEDDPFRKEAIPLYRFIMEKFKANDISFLNNM